MSDLISRQAAIDAINSWRGRFSEEYNEAIDDCENSIIELPPIQPEPQEGHWIKHKIRDQQFIQNGYELVLCSECGMETTANELAGISLLGEVEPHFCPNCGAKMKGEQQK